MNFLHFIICFTFSESVALPRISFKFYKFSQRKNIILSWSYPEKIEAGINSIVYLDQKVFYNVQDTLAKS